GYPWWYYPAFFVPPPPHFVPFGFSVGLWFGAPPLWGRCNWGWHESQVVVDVQRHNAFVQRVDRRPIVINVQETRTAWQHAPVHRRGVTYRDPRLQQQFGPTSTAAAPQRHFDRDDLRGRARTPAAGSARDRGDASRSRTGPPRTGAPRPDASRDGNPRPG